VCFGGGVAGSVAAKHTHTNTHKQHYYYYCTQDALVKEQPVVYNKEDLLNPAFIVFGRRRPDP
jgi:hypothetical protein